MPLLIFCFVSYYSQYTYSYRHVYIYNYMYIYCIERRFNGLSLSLSFSLSLSLYSRIWVASSRQYYWFCTPTPSMLLFQSLASPQTPCDADEFVRKTMQTVLANSRCFRKCCFISQIITFSLWCALSKGLNVDACKYNEQREEHNIINKNIAKLLLTFNVFIFFSPLKLNKQQMRSVQSTYLFICMALFHVTSKFNRRQIVRNLDRWNPYRPNTFR